MHIKLTSLVVAITGILLVSISSCSDEGDGIDPQGETSHGVCMSGYSNLGCIWVNGKKSSLGTIFISDAKVFNDTVYACGVTYEYDSLRKSDQPVYYYYVGDKKVNLHVSSRGPGAASSVWATGKDVYVGGQNEGKPCYWVNGVIHYLPTEGVSGSVDDIVIKDNTVYCSGNFSPYYNMGCYWVNDQQYFLQDKGAPSWASGIFVDDHDVYVSGTSDASSPHGAACYWKNGVRKNLSFLNGGVFNSSVNGPVTISEANDIFVHNGDVYVSGRFVFGDETQNYQRIEMCYWKNDDRTDLIALDRYARPKIAVDDTAVYVAGDTSLWINDKIVPLDNRQHFPITSIQLF